MAYSTEDGFFEVPVFSSKIVDRVGAGDAYLSVAAPCVALGMPMDLVGFIGNAVGALAVRIVGNRTAVEPVPLYKFITALLK
jgi:sugar/nucleoside kinase (ribokinase family)